MSQPVDNNKNFSELTMSQKTFGRTLKAVAITLLALSILVCVLTTMKALDLQGHKEWYTDRWGRQDWKWVEAAPNYASYMGTAIGTGLGVVPLSLFAYYALTRRVYHKDLKPHELETLRTGNFHDVQKLLFWDLEKKSWSEKRIASLESAVREGQLTLEHVDFFDNETLTLQKKRMEFRKFEKTSAAKTEKGDNLPPLTRNSSPKMKQDHPKLESILKEIRALTEEWEKKHKDIIFNGELESRK